MGLQLTGFEPEELELELLAATGREELELELLASAGPEEELELELLAAAGLEVSAEPAANLSLLFLLPAGLPLVLFCEVTIAVKS